MFTPGQTLGSLRFSEDWVEAFDAVTLTGSFGAQKLIDESFHNLEQFW